MDRPDTEQDSGGELPSSWGRVGLCWGSSLQTQAAQHKALAQWFCALGWLQASRATLAPYPMCWHGGAPSGCRGQSDTRGTVQDLCPIPSGHRQLSWWSGTFWDPWDLRVPAVPADNPSPPLSTKRFARPMVEMRAPHGPQTRLGPGVEGSLADPGLGMSEKGTGHQGILLWVPKWTGSPKAAREKAGDPRVHCTWC